MKIVTIGDWQVHGSRVVDAASVRQLADVASLRCTLVAGEAARRTRLAQVVRRARQAARKAGYEQGVAEGLAKVTETFARDMRRWRDTEAQIADAVCAVVDSVVGMLPDSLLLLSQIRKCFLAASNNPVLRIHVSDDEFDYVQATVKGLENELAMPCCEVVLDRHMRRGMCLVETANGIIDGGIAQQLAAIREGVLAALAPPAGIDP
jgi:type III secretion protein L